MYSDIAAFWQGEKSSPNAFLSNFYHHPFVAPDADGRMSTFQFSEQYFMYLKSLHFNQPDTAQYILDNPQLKPLDYKHIGRNLPNYDIYGESWEDKRVSVMSKAVFYKFKNKELREMLLKTGGAYLVEASPYDSYWGAGVRAHQIHSESDVPGSNYLGKILMAVRTSIRDKELTE